MKQNYDEIIVAVVCGVLSAFIDFYFIPMFLARGVEDYIWMTLMVVLPVIVSVVIMKYSYQCQAKSVIWSFATQIVLVLVFHSIIGNILGYKLGDLNWYLFEWLAYGIFVFGWISATSVVQYIVLRILNGRN